MNEERRGTDGRRIVVGIRPGDVRAREKAFAAARYALDNNANREDAASKFETNGTSVSEAILAIKHATPDELKALEANAMGLKELSRLIRKRTPREQRERKNIVRTDQQNEALKFDSNVWAELKAALEVFAGMPRPADVATICRRNAQRRDVVDRHLMTAFGWITEFSDEWTKRT